MNVARAMQADADDLLEKFLAAGTSYPIIAILGFGVLDLVRHASPTSGYKQNIIIAAIDRWMAAKTRGRFGVSPAKCRDAAATRSEAVTSSLPGC